MGVALVCVGSAVAAPAHKPPAQTRGPYVVATDYPDPQGAIDALPVWGGTVVLPNGNYRLTKTLDMTKKKNWRFISLVGQGYTSACTITVDTKDTPGIDLTGNAYCTFTGLRIVLRSCSVGVLMARQRGSGSAGCHVFRDVMIEGHKTAAHPGPAKAVVASLGSEVNRYYNCHFYSNKPGITCLYVSAHNELGLKSPYTDETRGGCNTELRMYGCSICMWGADTYGMQLIGYCNDVSIHGGYFSSKGIAAIRMDGTRASVGGVSISNVRMEAEHSKHIILSTGNVRNVTIDQGDWICGWGEPIRHGASSKTFTDPAYHTGRLRNAAHTWTVRDTFMSIWDGIDLQRNTPDPHRYPVGPDGYVMMRFNRLVHSHISGVSTVAYAYEKNAQGKVVGTYQSNRSAVVVDEYSRGNTFARLGSKVVLRGDARGNVVDTMGAVRRIAIGAGQPGSVLNLAPQDPGQIAQPQRGDVILVDGKRFADKRARLAVYDGTQWLYAELKAGAGERAEP